MHLRSPMRVKISPTNPLDIGSFLKLPPVKRHCSLLAEEAIVQALDDFKAKNPEKKF